VSGELNFAKGNLEAQKMCYNFFMFFYVLLFIISCFFLVISGNWLVKSLSGIAEFLGLKRFTVAFLLMSFATAMPELLVGISSALRGVPELSLGNIIGQNIIHFTVAVFLCVIIGGSFYVRSKTIRTTAFFSGFMALFPLLLILDGSLSRIDGVILIGLFLVYVFRMLKNGKRFDENYDNQKDKQEVTFIKKVGLFFSNLGRFTLGSLVLVLSAQGLVKSAMFFAEKLNVPLVIIGVLIIGLGTALPEVAFSAFSANKKDGELMAGSLLGSTVVSTSLVLGLVAIISPITGISFFSFFLSRLILFLSVLLFIFFMLTDHKISRKEGVVLIGLYLVFVLTEILI
jgi:cation:H+ antiporter